MIEVSGGGGANKWVYIFKNMALADVRHALLLYLTYLQHRWCIKKWFYVFRQTEENKTNWVPRKARKSLDVKPKSVFTDVEIDSRASLGLFTHRWVQADFKTIVR